LNIQFIFFNLDDAALFCLANLTYFPPKAIAKAEEDIQLTYSL